MRLLYVFIGFALLITLYLVGTGALWNEMVSLVQTQAEAAQVPTSQAAGG
jgi:hypothetical protein